MALGGGYALSRLGRRKKIRPEVPPHLAALQQQESPLAQALLGYGQQALQGGLGEVGMGRELAGLGLAGGMALPALGSALGAALAGSGQTGLTALEGFATEDRDIFRRPEYQRLFGGLQQQAGRAMRETVSPILSAMQATGLGTSSAAIGALGQAQERIMEDFQRRLSEIAAGAYESERQRQLAAAGELAQMFPMAYTLPEAGVMGGLQALMAGLQGAAVPREIAQSILGMSPLAETLLTMGYMPQYAPSVLSEIASAAGPIWAMSEVFRRRR